MSPHQRIGLAVASAVLLAGCMAEPNTAPTGRRITAGAAKLDQSTMDEYGYVYVCKKGGLPGSYNFHFEMTNGGYLQNVFGPDETINFNGTDLACSLMAYVDQPDTWIGKNATATMTEQLAPGAKVDSIQIYSSTTGIQTTVYNTNVASRPFVFGERLWFKYYNSTEITPPPTPGYVRACKVGGPAGTYSFHVDVLGGGTYSLPSGSTTSVMFDGTNPACATMYVPTGTWTAGQTASVEISEVNIASNLEVKSITVTTNGVAGSPLTNTSSTTSTVAFTDVVSVDFVNGIKPPPTNLGNQGCTPGYWKVKQHWDSWAGTGYTTTQALSTVFTIPASYTVKNKWMGNYSMVEGLSFQGGSTVSDKAQILIRAAVAAVLNAGKSNVAYAMTSADIISQVNAALASQNATTITTLATKLDGYNNGQGGCPLN